jgi:FKBP-type peptidyl-prolyl cis-trans isomerase 2
MNIALVLYYCIFLSFPFSGISFAPFSYSTYSQHLTPKTTIMMTDDVSAKTSSSEDLSSEPYEIVTIKCRLKPEGSYVPEPLFDGISSSPETLSFVLQKGNYLPGLHDLVSTMKVGESIQNQSLDAGWGAWNPNLQAQLDFEALAASGIDISLIKKGVELVMGNGMTAVVTEISDNKKSFTVDANPPLSGASYLCDVILLCRENGPTEFLYNPGPTSDKYQVATFAIGCFWGGELAYMREQGVVGTKVGFTQGKTVNPTYKEVCSGSTGHTEAIMVIYDSTVVSYQRLIHLGMDRLGESKYLLNQVGNDK